MSQWLIEPAKHEQKLGISVEFPCDESLSYEAEIKGRR